MDLLERFKKDVKAGGDARMREIAAATGVTLGTLRNIRYGQSKNPRYNNVEKLRQFYERQAA
jgi:transcriptional regulator with XRE-family HTH domain